MNKTIKAASDTIWYFGMAVAGISAIACGYAMFERGVTGFCNDVVMPVIKTVDKAIGSIK